MFSWSIISHPFVLSLCFMNQNRFLFFNPSSHSVTLIGEFVQLALRVIIDIWGLIPVILSFVSFALHLHFFSCFFLPFQCGDFLWFFFLFPSFSCFFFFGLFSRSLFYGYHVLYIKCPIDKIALFLLIASYIHLPMQLCPFLPPLLYFFLIKLSWVL